MSNVCQAIVLFSVTLFSNQALAQSNDWHHQSNQWRSHSNHHSRYSIDVDRLDRYADKLAEIAEHLHEDAHDLSQDYEHSQSIEYYVARLEDLNKHFHQILHDANRRGHVSSQLIRHLRSDTHEIRGLMVQLYRELSHQTYDGARSNDHRLIKHMLRIMSHEAFPLIRQIEHRIDRNQGHSWYHHPSQYRASSLPSIQFRW